MESRHLELDWDKMESGRDVIEQYITNEDSERIVLPPDRANPLHF